MSQVASRLAKNICAFKELSCVGGKLHLGSMFYLDFGSVFPSKSSSGATISIGLMTLSIRDARWLLKHNGRQIESAESIDSAGFDIIVMQLVGLHIIDVRSAEKDARLEFEFEDAWLLVVDISNLWESDSDLIQISLPDGRVIAVTETGTLDEEAGFDKERAIRWAASPLRH